MAYGHCKVNIHNQYGQRYLDAFSFYKYYFELRIPSLVVHFAHQRTALKELEFWEKTGALFPACRILTPRRMERFYLIQRLARNHTFTLPEGWSKEWLQLHDLQEKAYEWLASSIFLVAVSKTLNYKIHPFDEDHGLTKFLTKPSRRKFVSWANFDVQTSYKGLISKSSCAQPLYHYWQIHYIDAARRENTVKYFCRDGTSATGKQVCEYAPSQELLFRVGSRNLQKVERMFNVLSMYINARRREIKYSFETSGKRQTTGTVLEGEPLEACMVRCKDYAQKLKTNYKLYKPEAFDLLEVLAYLSLDYKHHEQIGLSNVARKDARHLNEYMRYAFGVDKDEAWKRIPDLAHVFPDVEKELRNDAIRMLGNAIKDFHLLGSKYQPNLRDLEEIVDFCQAHGYRVFLDTVKSIYEDWNFISEKSNEKLLNYLRNIAVLVEDFIRYLGMHASIDEVKNKFRDNPRCRLTNSLTYLFSKHGEFPWWSAFRTEQTKINNINLDDTEIYMNGILYKKSFGQQKQAWKNYLIRFLLISCLTRNFSAHRARVAENMLKFHYFEIFNSLLRTMVFVWMHLKIIGS